MNQVGHMFCNQRDKYESGCGRRDCVCQGLNREVGCWAVQWMSPVGLCFTASGNYALGAWAAGWPAVLVG